MSDLTAISGSFHRNVFLLTQIIPPSDDFKKVFREGMFDRPNTTGFLHVTHYLLTVYDRERFRKLLQWPVLCKKTEAKYRTDVKEFLITIANENPDIGFPTIQSSHLLHAGGSMFTRIMWKLSQVVLRVYITRETSYKNLPAPKAGAAGSLTKQFLEERTREINSNTMKACKQLSRIKETARIALEKHKEEIAQNKADIFEEQQSIRQLSQSAPVHPSISKRLLDINDTDVIEMWWTGLRKSIKYMEERNGKLKEIEELCSNCVEMILSISSDTNVLDGKKLRRIDPGRYLAGSFSPDILCRLYSLYKDDQLILHNFIELFSALLGLLYQRLQSTNLKDLSMYLPQIEASHENLKSALTCYEALLNHITEVSAERQNVLCEKNFMENYGDCTLPMMNNVLLMTSPVFRIDINSGDEKSDLQKRLELTPVEGAHKSLFSRYERHNQNQSVHRSKLRSNLLVSRINFDDIVSLSGSEKQPSHSRTIMPQNPPVSMIHAKKYSRLFSSHSTKRNWIANSSIMSIPSSSNANSTAITNVIDEMHDISEINLDITEKSICSINVEIVRSGSPESKELNESDNVPEKNKGVADHPRKPNIPVICATTEIEISSDKGFLKTEKGSHKRRSIGDLLERYKNLLELRNRNSPKISTIEDVIE